MIGRIAGVAAMIVAMAACGGGDAPMAGDGSSSSSTDAAGQPPETQGAVVEVDPCDLLTVEEVSAATGLEVQATFNDGPISCVFDLGEEAGVDVFVAVDDGQGRASGPAAIFGSYQDLVTSGDAESVEGVGAAAFFAERYRGLVARGEDGTYITLGVNGGFGALQDPRDMLVTLARAALGRLPEASA